MDETDLMIMHIHGRGFVSVQQGWSPHTNTNVPKWLLFIRFCHLPTNDSTMNMHLDCLIDCLFVWFD